MSVQNYAESWVDTYDQHKTVVNFVAGDYNSLKDVIRKYVASQNPENYNDWAESSEVGMFVNGLAYLGESIHYRVDLNAHDVFPSTTERRQSLLNFTKMLSYSPKRNICANGIAKLASISTTQSIQDTSGNNLKDVTINWDDAANKNWLEQFLTIMNSAFVSNNPFGKPLKKNSYNNITTQLYEFNSTTNQKAVFSFTSQVNGASQQFEVVNPDIDLDLNNVIERTPIPESAFHILYRNDGTGNASKNTGFFVYWKQGSLQSSIKQFTQKIENNSVDINVDNINEYDVWVQEVDSSSGLVKQNWTKIASNEYLVYNNTDIEEKNIFKVETKDGDQITIRFSDGNFGNIPVGVYRIWYRVSQGNNNLYIKPADMKNISIRIPYKANNTTDENIYYLTLVFNVEDVNHIKQSVVQESMEYIRERCPQVYSTQNRMVTGADYNKFPKSFGQQVQVLKSLNRTYSGNSRYIRFNDPTGTYQDLNVIATDGYLYKKDGLYTSETPIEDYNTPEQIIRNDIEPLLEMLSLSNYYYNFFPSKQIRFQRPTSSSVEKMYWNEEFFSGNNTSYGTFEVKTDLGTEQVSYDALIKQIKAGSMVKFKNDENDNEVWCYVNNITTVINNTSVQYEVELNEVLDSNYDWYAEEGYMPFRTTLDSQVKKDITNYLVNYVSFGLRYNNETSYWEVIPSYNSLSDDDVPFEYTSNVNYEEGQVKDWIIKIKYESSKIWTFKTRYLDYIYGSEHDVSFFFNTDAKNNNNTFMTDDYIKITKNQNDIHNLDKDYYWKPCDTIKYSDGYVDTKQFKVYGYDSDKDSTVDNPKQFAELSSDSNIYFLKSDNEYDEFMSDVKDVDDLWNYTTKTGTYYCKLSGTIYPSGTTLPKDITLTKNVQLSNGTTLKASVSNPVVFSKDRVYPYDIVDNGWATEYVIEDGETKIISDVRVESEMVNWNTKSETLTRYRENEDYYIRKGIKNLSFLWKHYASSSYVIDPCPTNIVDMFVLTNTYYQDVQRWLANNKRGSFPKLPSAYELKSIFSELENYSMVSDSLVWHPVKYKLLFGNEADNEFKAHFRVIKNETTTMSDNEIKQQIIQAVDEYFTQMKVGEKFFFTKLSTYIHSKMNDNIGTVLLVPTYNDEKFGNLFEIICDDDEILLSSATIDNVDIITKITDHNIKIGV